MANSLSAKKRVRQNARRRAINRWRMTRIRDAIKDLRQTVQGGNADEARTKLKSIYKLLDQIAATKTIHKNTASRYKSRLTTAVNGMGKKEPAAA